VRFVVWATDRQGMLAQRLAVRAEHRARLRDPAPHAVTVLAAGPTMDPGGQAMNGTLLVVEADDEQAVRAFVDGDPYMREGVYGSVEIRPWRCGLGALAESAWAAPSASPPTGASSPS
jgi:uncharacterized protein YciI